MLVPSAIRGHSAVNIPCGGQMLRITRADDPFRVRLDLAGRVGDEWVAVLKAECHSVLEAGRMLDVDLAAVRFADRDGVELLRTLQARGVALLHANPLIEELLDPSPTRSTDEEAYGTDRV